MHPGLISHQLTFFWLLNAPPLPANVYCTTRPVWNRDRELEADLFSSPRARTLKKLTRNPKIAPAEVSNSGL